MDWKPQTLARLVNELIGVDVVSDTHIRGFETGSRVLTRRTAALVALVYEPDPRGCLAYLFGRSNSIQGISDELLAEHAKVAPVPRRAAKLPKRGRDTGTD